MRPKVFIASSTPAKPTMKKLAGWLDGWNLEPIPWDQPGLFQPGDYILERLLEISLNVDAAIILFGDEDKAWYHKDAKVQPRDNVLIEYGIFASRLGRQRTIICRTGDPKNASDLGGLIFAQLGVTKAEIADAQARLQAWAQALPNLGAEARKRAAERDHANSARLDSGIDSEYRLPGGPILRILTGSLKDIRDIDVIVNSENQYLQPARFFDPQMSGTLRYLDAERNKFDQRVTRDAYLETIQSVMKQEGISTPVMPGSVIVAPTTGLRAQGIRYVFHAAIVHGEIERGYYAVEDSISDAVHNAFARLSDTAANPPLSSILFPVFGAGAGRLGPDLAATRLVNAIKHAVAATPQAKTVYLLAYIESHRVALRRAAEAAGLEPVGNRRRATRSS